MRATTVAVVLPLFIAIPVGSAEEAVPDSGFENPDAWTFHQLNGGGSGELFPAGALSLIPARAVWEGGRAFRRASDQRHAFPPGWGPGRAQVVEFDNASVEWTNAPSSGSLLSTWMLY
jgi:hypothetical protein